MSLRALHIINEPSGPGGLFLPPLESRGFVIDNVDRPRRELPSTLAGYDAVISCGGTANTHETDIHPWIEPADRPARRGAARRHPGDRPVPRRPAA